MKEMGIQLASMKTVWSATWISALKRFFFICKRNIFPFIDYYLRVFLLNGIFGVEMKRKKNNNIKLHECIERIVWQWCAWILIAFVLFGAKRRNSFLAYISQHKDHIKSEFIRLINCMVFRGLVRLDRNGKANRKWCNIHSNALWIYAVHCALYIACLLFLSYSHLIAWFKAIFDNKIIYELVE